MLRNFVIVFVMVLAVALPLQSAFAQVVVGTPTRIISSVTAGYCFTTDTNNNNTVDLNEIGVTGGTEAMTSAAVPARDAVTTGGRTFTPSYFNGADNWGDITTIGNYQINIDAICVGGVSRTDNVSTDYDDSDPADGTADRTEETTRTETSSTDNYYDDDGFTFVGGSLTQEQIISFIGQVDGNIAAVAGASNVVFTLGTGSEINGVLDLTGLENAVINLSGQIDEVELGGSSDINLTSAATIGDAGSGKLSLSGATDIVATLSGAFGEIDLSAGNNMVINNSGAGASIDATSITNGLQFTNSGAVSAIDFSDTDYLTATLAAGSNVGTLTANNITNPSSYISNAGTIERLEIGNSSASDKVELSIINSGSITANTNDAIVINDTDAGGGDIDVIITNSGTIFANTSDAINFTGLDGGRIDLINSGTVSAASSVTNNAILGDGGRGLFYLSNEGEISNNNNRAISLQNFEGFARLINSGSINTNQEGINLTGASAVSTTAVEIYNGYTLNASDQIEVATTGDREIKTAGSNAVLLDNITGDIEIYNAVGASIIAEDQFAIAGDSITGDVALATAGNIRAHRATPGLSNEQAISLTAVTGDIEFVSLAGLIDARDRTMTLETINGTISFINAGTISSTQTLNDADATATDNYTVRLQRTGTIDDESAIANSGTISSTSDHALLLDGIVCDGDAEDDEYCLDNSGTISAGRQFALGGTTLTDFKFKNTGTVTAYDQTINLIDLDGEMELYNSGTISATQAFVQPFPDPDSTKYGIRLVKLAGGDGALTFINAASGVISTAEDNALQIVDFDGANDDVDFTNDGQILAVGDVAVDLTDAMVSKITNGGTIAAGGNYALLVDGLASASMVVSNTGGITAGTVEVGNAPAAIYGTLAASATNISITNGASAVISSVGNELASSDANSGGAIFLDAAVASFALENSGTIYVGSEATSSASAVQSNYAIRVTDIGANEVSLENNTGGTIKAEGDTAIFLEGDSADIASFSLTNAGTITADNDVILLTDIAAASAVISNSGTISATDDDADHLLNFSEVSADFSLTNSGTISTAGTRAIYVDMNSTALSGDEMVVFNNQSGGTISADNETVTFLDVSEQVNFDNSGTIAATSGASAVVFSDIGAHQFDFNNNSGGTIISSGGNAVVLTDQTDKVSIVNDGVIEVTAGNNAFSSWAGDETVFTNSGRIEASGNNAVFFDNFIVSASTAAPKFTNTATGIIRAASGAFAIDIGAATGQIYTLENAGSIIADNGAHAVNMSGAQTSLTNSGTISATASPAVLVGEDSTLNISGKISAGGTEPVAVALEGRGSIVNLSNGVIIVGTIAPLDTGTDYTDAEKHRVNLTGADNASYYYEFPTAQMRFFINEEEKTDGTGFSAATVNYEAVPLMHAHHAKSARNIWRQLGRFSDNGGLRSFAFTDDLEDESNTKRSFALEGDRNGFVQSFQQANFGWFDAELILIANETSFSLDNNVFTFDKAYQGAGFGFSDLASFGPFSLSAMALTGIGQTDMSRLVLTNTNATGSFNLKSSFDTVYFDAVYEALFAQRIMGRETRLSRRNPYRVNLELGLGGAVHSENNDSYAEKDYVSSGKSDLQSNSVSGRLKLELETRRPYFSNKIHAFLEYEQTLFDITSGTDFSYSVQGTAAQADVASQKNTLQSLSIGAEYVVSDDMHLSFSYAASSDDNDSSETSLKAAAKWRF